MRNILYTRFFDEKITENVNIILSPQFYWIKKIDIPIKSLSEAKKISQNLFDLKGEYLFFAININNQFFAIAINKNLDIKIDKKYIASIRIAQTELSQYNTINLDNNYQLQKIEDILFCFPNNTKDAPHINDILKDLKLSKQTINLYNTIDIDKSTIILLSIIFILFSTTLILQTYSYKTQKIDFNTLKKYNLPLTKIQLNSILKNLKTIDYNNLLLKKDLKFFTNTPLNKNEKFISLEKTNNSFIVIIKTNKNLNSYFKQRFKIKHFSLTNNIYKAELTHE